MTDLLIPSEIQGVELVSVAPLDLPWSLSWALHFLWDRSERQFVFPSIAWVFCPTCPPTASLIYVAIRAARPIAPIYTHTPSTLPSLFPPDARAGSRDQLGLASLFSLESHLL